MKKINTWRQQLKEIMLMEKKQGELVPENQSKRLQELAQEMGASTRAIGYHPDGIPFGYDASIAGLIDNINQAIQTATSIKNSEYTRRSVYITIVAVAVSMLALVASIYFSAQNVSVAQEANKFTRDSLELQRNEFKLRNRPYLAIHSYNFSNREYVDLQGKKWPCCIEFKLTNISEIPANNIKVLSEVYLNGKSIRKTNYLPVALSKGTTKTVTVGLPEDIYSDAKNEENRIEIKNDITYFGMLSKGSIKHSTDETVYYSPTEEVFKVIKQKYQ